jgi:hypothetical protein
MLETFPCGVKHERASSAHGRRTSPLIKDRVVGIVGHSVVKRQRGICGATGRERRGGEIRRESDDRREAFVARVVGKG